jgi:hypothetical protein
MPGGCVAVVEVGMKRLFLVNLPIFLSLSLTSEQEIEIQQTLMSKRLLRKL